jgi:hypothetical protein
LCPTCAQQPPRRRTLSDSGGTEELERLGRCRDEIYIYIVVKRKRAPEPGEIGARETKKQNKKNVGTGVFQ